MDWSTSWSGRVAELLGPLSPTRPLGGGFLAEAGGRRVVVKPAAGALDEADGLRLIASVGGAPPVPQVLVAEEGLLVTSYVEQSARTAGHEERLGAALARLHRAPWPNYGGGSSFIGETTLDLCGGSYPSENLRTGRLQVSYAHPKKTVDISNEVVTYVSGGAQQALAEVSKVAHTCSTKSVIQKRGVVTTTFHVTPVHDPKLPHNTVAVKLVIKQSNGTKHVTQTGIAIYEVKGNTLSGVYTFATKGTSFADVQRVAFHAAEQSAKNLGVGKKKSGGTGFTA